MEADKINTGTIAGTEIDSYQRFKETGNLPTPSDKALKIYHLAHDNKASIADIATVVMTDPAIAAKIVKTANSAFYKSLNPITSVDRAIIRLGLNMVKTISLGYSLISRNKNGSCEEFDYDAFWAETLARAVVARDITVIKCKDNKSKRKLNPDEAFTIGLFCQIGRLAFATTVPSEYSQVLRQVSNDNDNYEQLLDIEKQTFGINHSELAAEMMTDWGLPETYSKAVRFQKSPNYEGNTFLSSAEGEITEILDTQDWYLWMLKWTGTMSAIMMQSEVRLSKAAMEYAIEEAEQLGLSPDDFPKEYDSITENWDDLSYVLEVKKQKAPTWNEIYKQANE
jgi:two-component system cell cycle response regulator